jgi:hypothetical protein
VAHAQERLKIIWPHLASEIEQIHIFYDPRGDSSERQHSCIVSHARERLKIIWLLIQQQIHISPYDSSYGRST